MRLLPLVALAGLIAGCHLASERGDHAPEITRYEIRIERDGELVGEPSVLVQVGESATVELGDEESGDQYEIQILTTGQVKVSAILRDGELVIAEPTILVEVDEPAKVRIDDGERICTLAVEVQCDSVQPND